MKDAEEALSNSARASIEKPLGEVIMILHVIRRVFDFKGIAVAEIAGIVSECGREVVALALSVSFSTCNKVWWDL